MRGVYANNLEEERKRYVAAIRNLNQYRQDAATKTFQFHAYKEQYEIVFHNTVASTLYQWRQQDITSIGIECKPALGDDYPAVLRLMRNIKIRPGIYCLVIGHLSSQAATLAQLKIVCAQAGITLLTVAEIDATDPLVTYVETELPNPLEQG